MTCCCRTKQILILACGLLAALAGYAVATGAQKEETFRKEVAGVSLSVTPRMPEQVAAFYEARGFSREAVKALAEACFLTTNVLHRRQDVVWLELDNWRFRDAEGREIARLPRQYWVALWEQVTLPQGKRATFGWTQLPESRDLRTGEPVGGNVVLVPPTGEFSLEARFRTGAFRREGEIVVRLSGLRCPGQRVGRRP